jgi:ubiquinol-cytochrome c reductase cytochrome b subunit
MTLKSKEYIEYLKENIYKEICTSTPVRPWPNPKTGKLPTQYAFNTKTLPALSVLHNEWYSWSESKCKYIKIVPLNISEFLTPLGLAHWIMGDGYWDKSQNTTDICTDNFTLEEVELLIKVLDEKFDLLSTVKRRIKLNKEVCWRIRFSSKSENITKLRLLVKPYIIPSMYYKLNIN